MIHRQILAAGLLLLSAGVASRTSAATVNGFANGDFETAGLTTPAEAWREAAEGYTISSDAYTGSFSAQLMSPQLNAAVMLQNSIEDGMRPPLTAGDNPILSFWSKGFAGTTGNVLFALRYLDGNGVILSDSGNQFFESTINPNTWTEITYDLGVVPAGAESAFIEFSQGIGPIDDMTLLPGTVLIDDVHLGVISAVPEPGSALVLSMFGLVVLRRRRR